VNIYQRIRQLFYSIRNLSLTDEKAWNPSLWNLVGSQSLSGETVTEATALTYPAVWNATSLISGTIGALPLHLMQKKGEKKRMADEKKLYFLMHDQWNPYMTAMSGRETMMAHMLLWGNGYAEKVKNGYGDVIELWPIAPNRVKIRMFEGQLIYLIRVNNEDIPLTRENILHVPGLGFDGWQGYSVIAMARKSLGLGMAMETFGSRFFGEGTHPGIIVEHPGQLKDPAKLRDALAATYSGLGKSHRIMLLEEGMKATKIVIDPKDSQFLESRAFQIPEVARWFNLPPHKLKDLSKSSFNNIEQEQISFVTDSILPWLIRLEQNYNMQLLTTGDKALYGQGRLYFKHNVDGLLRGDAQSRAQFYQIMLDRGVFSINEVRELEDKDPVPGGDIHLVAMNMTTLENAGKSEEPAKTPAGGNGKDKSNEPLQIPADTGRV
jgi:HK97 family phage portal protein